MNRTLIGALAALMLVAAGVFWWQGRAAVDSKAPPPELAAAPEDGESDTGEAAPDDLPTDHASKRGVAPPVESEASKLQRSFDRLDRNHDGRVTVEEMLLPRGKAFKKLDINGDNLLSFDEWSVSTRNRFKKMDLNGDGRISVEEYAAARAKRESHKRKCACPSGKGGGPPDRGGDD